MRLSEIVNTADKGICLGELPLSMTAATVLSQFIFDVQSKNQFIVI